MITYNNYVCQLSENYIDWVPTGIPFMLSRYGGNWWRLHIKGEYDCYAFVIASDGAAIVEFLEDLDNASALFKYYLDNAYYHSDGSHDGRSRVWYDISSKRVLSLADLRASR